MTDLSLTRGQLAELLDLNIETINNWDRRGYFGWPADHENERKPGQHRRYNLRKTWRAYVMKNIDGIGIVPGLGSEIANLAEVFCPPGNGTDSVVGIIVRRADKNFKLSHFELSAVELVRYKDEMTDTLSGHAESTCMIYIDLRRSFSELRHILMEKHLLTKEDVENLYENNTS